MNQVANQAATELISLPSRYEKSINLHLQKFIGKSQKPLLNQNNLLPCFAFSLLHYSHVTYPTHQDINSSLCHACYIFEYFYLHIFRVNCLLKRHLSHGHRISCPAPHMKWTANKPFSRLIALKYINKQENCPLKLVSECSSRIQQLSESI